ncbi:hypothetical protein SCUCBS95973_003847 [Sporothrix curviconia]|uniref:Uncharacterized protein n=1 Tax=Sporothrix curviconia TaxID=1260050 RepID=A0ABP0BIU0_9PEZI
MPSSRPMQHLLHRAALVLLFTLTGHVAAATAATDSADSPDTSLASLNHLLDGLDAAPLNEGFTYSPDFHACPLPCSDYANVFSWVRYWTPDQLQRCDEPLLMQFSVRQPQDPALPSGASMP